MSAVVSNYAFEDIGVHKCAIEEGGIRSIGFHRADGSLQKVSEWGVMAGGRKIDCGIKKS